MPVRLVALDEGPDIPLDREMLVVGRHPQCDARLDSIRVSRRHCCMTPDNGEVIVKDLGSTNGIRINGQRVEKGRLRIGDELSIAHIRYRVDDGNGQEMTVAGAPEDRSPDRHGPDRNGAGGHGPGLRLRPSIPTATPPGQLHGPRDEDNPLAAAVREMLPAAVADKCRIQVIVQMPQDAPADLDGEDLEIDEDEDHECRPDSSH